MRATLYTFIALYALSCPAADWEIKGQASGWNNSAFEAMQETQLGLRYIPEISVAWPVYKTLTIDADVSLNMTGAYDFADKSSATTFGTHRAWLRLATNQFEARFGLQQIKFGPAMILRPLMWFDQIDPRDPLQFTNGVAAGLARYYFLNNANIWLWGIYSDGERKGLEILPSGKNSLEYGGHLQYPVGPGELAFSYHYREADIGSLLEEWPYMIPLIYEINLGPIPERRYALDGKWDIGIGLWFESVLAHKEVGYFMLDYEKYITIGADYTFSLGNGLHVLAEHLRLTTSQEWDGADERYQFSALLVDYSLTVWDMVMGMFYYDWENDDVYNFLTWRRTFDNWSFNTSLYWNPETFALSGLTGRQSSSAGAGRGFQVMVVFNH